MVCLTDVYQLFFRQLIQKKLSCQDPPTPNYLVYCPLIKIKGNYSSPSGKLPSLRKQTESIPYTQSVLKATISLCFVTAGDGEGQNLQYHVLWETQLYDISICKVKWQQSAIN